MACRMYIRSLLQSFCRQSGNRSYSGTMPSALQKKIRNASAGIRNRRGSQMVEAAVAVPVIILTAMLLLRLFTFYLEILNTGISEHMTALDAWDSYTGAGFSSYTSERDVRMLRGGLLNIDLTKTIDTRSYLINEDRLVRAGDVL